MSNGNVFAVTTQEAGSIDLEPGARRQVVFNVQNLTGRPIEGRARAVVEGMPAQQAWYTVQGRMERRFDVDEVHQFIVEVAIPDDAQAGRYSFLLEVNSVARPDEDFGRSEKLLIVVPEPARAGGGASIPWWVWVVAASLVLVVGGIVTWILVARGGGVEVPELVGQPVAEAVASLEELGVRWDTTVEATVEPGVVFSQEPEAGETIGEEDEVTLVVGGITDDEAIRKAQAIFKDWWSALVAGDLDTVVDLSTTPFLLDGLITSDAELRARLEELEIDDELVRATLRTEIWTVAEFREGPHGGDVDLFSPLRLEDDDLVGIVRFGDFGDDSGVAFRRSGDLVQFVGVVG